MEPNRRSYKHLQPPLLCRGFAVVDCRECIGTYLYLQHTMGHAVKEGAKVQKQTMQWRQMLTLIGMGVHLFTATRHDFSVVTVVSCASPLLEMEWAENIPSNLRTFDGRSFPLPPTQPRLPQPHSVATRRGHQRGAPLQAHGMRRDARERPLHKGAIPARGEAKNASCDSF